MMKILCLDYGRARIGVAVNRGSLAEPLIIVPNTPQAFDEIKKIIDEENIDQIVIGLSENQMAEETKDFAQKLQQFLTTKLQRSIPIEFIDETLSSKEVANLMIQSGKKMLDRRQPQDHFVAAYLLEQYLENLL